MVKIRDLAAIERFGLGAVVDGGIERSRLERLQDEEASRGPDAGSLGAAGVAGKKMVGPAGKRDCVAHLEGAMGLRERRARTLVGADRRVIRYKSRRPLDTELRERVAGAGRRASPLPLPAAVCPAQARRRGQPHLLAVSRIRPPQALSPSENDFRSGFFLLDQFILRRRLALLTMSVIGLLASTIDHGMSTEL